MRVWLVAGFGDNVDAVPAIRVDDASAVINPGMETRFKLSKVLSIKTAEKRRLFVVAISFRRRL
jgi:hypothetical protein